MTDFLRLLLTPVDLARIDPASIVVTETPFRPAPAAAADPRPESMRLQFRINDPEAGAPQLRMIFPGELRFQPNAPTGAQQMPSAANITFTGSNVDTVAFAKWPNRGVLRVRANATKIAKALAEDNKIAGIGLPPLIAWFDPVVMTLDFLNGALLNGMTRWKFKISNPPNPDKTYEGTTPGWNTHAVERFYQGLYLPLLNISEGKAPNRNHDDVIRFPMPRLAMTAKGEVDIRITLGSPLSQADVTAFNDPNPLNLPEHHPGHPNVETLPTRVFFQQHRAQIIGSNASKAVVDTIIGDNTFAKTTKANLSACGFGSLGPVNNSFDLRAHWAVREFQIYAKMLGVATEPVGSVGEYANRLQKTNNPKPYHGPINGFLNAATRERLDLWVAPDQRLRCPVVVTARVDPDYLVAAGGGENLWAHDDFTETEPRIFVRDLSGYYANLTKPDSRDVIVKDNRFIVLGTYLARSLGGPNVDIKNSWSTMEIDTKRLMGVDRKILFGASGNAAMRSTYQTIVPTMFFETSFRFDVVNAWDNKATISIPLLHYSLFSKELGGFLSYIAAHEPATFASTILFFGIKPHETWAEVRHQGAKRISRMQQIRDAGGTWADVTEDRADQDYFKNWHWFYRLVMANRLNDNWKLRAYEFARLRLQDLRRVAMTERPENNLAIAPKTASGAAASLGQVFTSELAMALLLRWHVNRPGQVARGRTTPYAAPHLWKVMRRAQEPATNGGHKLVWHTDVATWGNDHEGALIEAIIGHVTTVKKTLGMQLGRIRDEGGDGKLVTDHPPLLRSRRSFQFDAP